MWKNVLESALIGAITALPVAIIAVLVGLIRELRKRKRNK